MWKYRRCTVTCVLKSFLNFGIVVILFTVLKSEVPNFSEKEWKKTIVNVTYCIRSLLLTVPS